MTNAEFAESLLPHRCLLRPARHLGTPGGPRGGAVTTSRRRYCKAATRCAELLSRWWSSLPHFPRASASPRPFPRASPSDPITALTEGASLAVVSLAELSKLPRENGMVPPRFGIAPLPGTKRYYDRSAFTTSALPNYIPYHSGGLVGVVRSRCANVDAAFDLLAELGGPGEAWRSSARQGWVRDRIASHISNGTASTSGTATVSTRSAPNCCNSPCSFTSARKLRRPRWAFAVRTRMSFPLPRARTRLDDKRHASARGAQAAH